jgi:ATP-dependent DNA helicase RecG
VQTSTEVEHVGDRLTVTSPGGFIGGVRPDNIITYPSTPRYARLAEALSKLRIAEREGIGVDRMHREMLMLGHPRPEMEQLPGPMVRATLVGGEPDEAWLQLRGELTPTEAGIDLDLLALLDETSRAGWISGPGGSVTLQRGKAETNDALARLSAVHMRSAGAPVVVGVRGDPKAEGDPYDAAWRLSSSARALLARARRHGPPPRERILLEYARARGRISTTEAASLLDCTPPPARRLLDRLEKDGRLKPGRDNRAGRGFFYVPTPSD